MNKYSKNIGYTVATVRRYSALFIKIRSIIISIYDYKCIICGLETINLEIHHADKNHKNDDVLNLKPLCSECHKKLHKSLAINWPALTKHQKNQLERLRYITSKYII